MAVSRKSCRAEFEYETVYQAGLIGSRMSDLTANTGCLFCDLNLIMNGFADLMFNKTSLDCIVELNNAEMINSLCKLVSVQYLTLFVCL